MAEQEIKVEQPKQNSTPQTNLTDAKVKAGSSSSPEERKGYQRELGTSKPETVTEKVRETNRRIEDDVILNSGNQAKLTRPTTSDSHRRVVETNQMNQNLSAPTTKRKRRGRSIFSLRSAKAGLAKLMELVDLDDLQEDVKGNSDNLAAMEAAEKELATKLNGVQLAEQITSQNNEIESQVELLEKQNLSEPEIKFVEEKYKKIAELAEEIAKVRYRDTYVDHQKLKSLEQSRKSELAELDELFSKHSLLKDSFAEARQEVEDYYALKFIQLKIISLAGKKAASNMELGNYRRSSEKNLIEWKNFKAQITKELLHRRPELKDVVDQMWDKALAHETELYEKGKRAAEKVYAELKGGKDADTIYYAMNKLNRRSFLALVIHYRKLTGRYIDNDISNKIANRRYFCWTGSKDSLLKLIKSIRSRNGTKYEGISIDSYFYVEKKKDAFKKRIRAKAFSLEASQLTLALTGKSSFCDALISLSSRSESSRAQIKKELEQVYGNKFSGLSASRQKLLEKAFSGKEITKDEFIELAFEEYTASGTLHGKMLASPEFTSSGLSIDLKSVEKDFERLTVSNPTLKQLFLEAYNRALSKARSAEIIIVYQGLLADERRLEGINGDDALKLADEARDKVKAYLANQKTFISQNSKLDSSIKSITVQHKRSFNRDKRNLGRATREIYSAGSNYKKVRSILINLSAEELNLVRETFKEYGLTLEQHIVKKFSDYGTIYGTTNYRSNLLALIQQGRGTTPSKRGVKSQVVITVDKDLMKAAKDSVTGETLESNLILLNRSLDHPLGAIRLYISLASLPEQERTKAISEYEARFGSIKEKIKKRYTGKNLVIALAAIEGKKVKEQDFLANIQLLMKVSARQYAQCTAAKQKINADEALVIVNELVSYVKSPEVRKKLVKEFETEFRQGYGEYIIFALVQNSYRRGIEKGKSSRFIDGNRVWNLDKKRGEILEQHKAFIDAQPKGFLEQIEKQEKIAFDKGRSLAIACDKKVINMDFACNGNGGWGTDEAKLFLNMRASSPEERALIQELYKAKVGHSVQWELQDELGGYYLDKGEAIMRGDRVGEIAAEAALALNTWWGMNPDEGRTIRALEELQMENLGVEGANLREEFLEVFNELYAPDFNKKTFQDVTKSSFNQEEKEVRDALLKGDPRSVAIVRLKYAKKEQIAVQLEKLVLNPETGEVSKEKLAQLHKDLNLSDDETVEGWIKDRFRETSIFSVEGFDYNYMKWALALVDGKENAHLRARAHKVNYSVVGAGTNEAFIEEACAGRADLVLILQKDPDNKEAKDKLKAEAEFIKDFYKKEYSRTLKNDLLGDLTGVLAEVEMYRLEHGFLSEVQKLKYAIGNDDLNAAMAILQGKTTSQIEAIEKELLDTTDVKGMFAGEYDSLEELITAHFALDDERQLKIELIGIPDNIPRGVLNEEGKKALEQVEKLIEARYENARLGIDALSNLMTSTGKQLDEETNEIRRILTIAREDNFLSEEQAQKLETLIQRQGMLSTSHCEAAASLGDMASNYVAGAVIIIGVVGTSIFSGGAAVPFWIGVASSAGASLVARQGTRTMFVGSNTFASDTMVYDTGMASLDGLTFGAGSVITGKLANGIYTKVGQRLLATEAKVITEVGKKPAVTLLGQSVVEKTFLRRLGMRGLEGMADGAFTGYIHGASITAFDESTWENGFINGLVTINYNGTLGSTAGIAMGGTLALPFAFVKPPVVKMSQQISPEKAMKGGLLESMGIEDTFLNTLGKKLGLSRNKMSKAEVMQALETKGIVTKGDVEISSLNGKKLSDKRAKKLISKADKLLKDGKITPEQMSNLNALKKEGSLTELHFAQIDGVAPTYIVDVSPDVLRVRQIKLDKSGFKVKVEGGEPSFSAGSKTKQEVSTKPSNLKKSNETTKSSSSEKTTSTTKQKDSDTTKTSPAKEADITPSVKSDREFLEILARNGVSDELRISIEKGSIKTIDHLDKYLASPMGVADDVSKVALLKRLNEKGILEVPSAPNNKNVKTDGDVDSGSSPSKSNSQSKSKADKNAKGNVDGDGDGTGTSNTNNSEGVEGKVSKGSEDKGGNTDNGNGNGDGNGNSGNGDGSGGNGNNVEPTTNNSGNKELQEQGSVMVMDDIAKEEQVILDLVNGKAKKAKKQTKAKNASSEKTTSSDASVRTDKDLEPNRPLTEQESRALDQLVNDKNAPYEVKDLGAIRADKKINDSDITAFELEDFMAKNPVLADALPDNLKGFATRRFKPDSTSTAPKSSGSSAKTGTAKEVNAEELLAKLQDARKRLSKIKEAKKDAYEQTKGSDVDFELSYKDKDSLAKESEIDDLTDLISKLGRSSREVRANDKNKEHLDHKSLQERYKEIDSAVDDIVKAIEKEEAGFMTDLFEGPPSHKSDGPLFDSDGGGGPALGTQKKQSELQAIAERVSSKLGTSKEIKPKPAKPVTESSTSTSRTAKVDKPTPKLVPDLDIDAQIGLQLSLREGLQTSSRHSLRPTNAPKNSNANQPAKKNSPAPSKQSSIPDHIALTPKTRADDEPNGKRRLRPDLPIFNNEPFENKKEIAELEKAIEEELARYGNDDELDVREHDPSAVRYKIVTIKGNIYRQRFERSTQASSNDQWVMTYSQLIGKVEDNSVA